MDLMKGEREIAGSMNIRTQRTLCYWKNEVSFYRDEKTIGVGGLVEILGV